MLNEELIYEAQSHWTIEGFKEFSKKFLLECIKRTLHLLYPYKLVEVAVRV